MTKHNGFYVLNTSNCFLIFCLNLGVAMQAKCHALHFSVIINFAN